jgi:hypothetical protein
MKILYIGHYKENSGWSQAAIDYILALDSVGVDVVCRNVKLTNAEPTLPSKILFLESKDLDGIDYCIQHVLPHHLVSTNKFKKNIAYFAGETNTIKHLSWFENLNNMDEVWVPNSQYKATLETDGIKTVRCVPHTFNLDKYKLSYPRINFGEYNNHFKFYTISDLNDRKNIDSILRCYYSEFNSEDNVVLVLKLRKSGVSGEYLSQYVKKLIDTIKNELRIHKDISKYPPEIIISTDIQEQGVLALHQSCDCFIGISHGEAWSIPAFDAMCFGKTPICSNDGGPADFIDKNDPSTGTLIGGCYDVCNHSDPAFMELCSGKEEWFHPSESLTKKAMRLAVLNKEKISMDAGLNNATKYNYNNVGNLMKDYLND